MSHSKYSPAKQQALHQQGTLYLHAAAVTDPLFQHHFFFDPDDDVQVKYEMLRRVAIDHISVSKASTTFGFSRPAFYHARAAFAEQGLAGLLPRPRGPQNAHKLTIEVMQFIAALRCHEPSLHASEWAQRLYQHLGLRVHPRSLERGWRRLEKKRRFIRLKRFPGIRI